MQPPGNRDNLAVLLGTLSWRQTPCPGGGQSEFTPRGFGGVGADMASPHQAVSLLPRERAESPSGGVPPGAGAFVPPLSL